MLVDGGGGVNSPLHPIKGKFLCTQQDLCLYSWKLGHLEFAYQHSTYGVLVSRIKWSLNQNYINIFIILSHVVSAIPNLLTNHRPYNENWKFGSGRFGGMTGFFVFLATVGREGGALTQQYQFYDPEGHHLNLPNLT